MRSLQQSKLGGVQIFTICTLIFLVPLVVSDYFSARQELETARAALVTQY